MLALWRGFLLRRFCHRKLAYCVTDLQSNQFSACIHQERGGCARGAPDGPGSRVASRLFQKRKKHLFLSDSQLLSSDAYNSSDWQRSNGFWASLVCVGITFVGLNSDCESARQSAVAAQGDLANFASHEGVLPGGAREAHSSTLPWAAT